MGQKINPHILRLGINNNEWNSKYLEKNIEEATLYTYKNTQIQKYIVRILNLLGLSVHTCKTRYNNNHVNIIVSYYCTKKFFTLVQKLSLTNKYKISLKKKKNLNRIFYNNTANIRKIPKKRLLILKYYKTILKKKKFNSNQLSYLNKFSNKIITSLSLYFSKQLNINLIMQNLNKGLGLRLLNKEAQLFRSLVLRLRKFSNNFFFKETISIILITIRIKKSAQFLGNFIANKLSFMKRHNYFLNFLKSSLEIFIKSTLSKILGIKIIIKGRFNGAPRARKKMISIGNVPTQQIKSNLDYHEAVSFTNNGTFGVKVWISYK